MVSLDEFSSKCIKQSNDQHFTQWVKAHGRHSERADHTSQSHHCQSSLHRLQAPHVQTSHYTTHAGLSSRLVVETLWCVVTRVVTLWVVVFTLMILMTVPYELPTTNRFRLRLVQRRVAESSDGNLETAAHDSSLFRKNR